MKSQQIPFHLLNSLQQALHEILIKSFHADRIIDKYLRANPNWSTDHRSFFVETLYDVLRNKLLLYYISETNEENNNSIWNAIEAWHIINKQALPKGRPELNSLDSEKVKKLLSGPKSDYIQYSFLEWLNKLCLKEFGNVWPQIMSSLNLKPEIFLRANSLKTNTQNLLNSLRKENYILEAVSLPNSTEALKLNARKSFSTSKAFREGFFEIQDAGSQQIVPLLNLTSGLNVADVCSGSGGKTLQIANLMKNQGSILATDIFDWKLKDLQKRASKAEVSIIETRLIKNSKSLTSLNSSFDRVLIDSPCSGLGVLKRNPDTKWSLTEEGLNSTIKLQTELLRNYSKLCKPQGLLVYATCSILKSENEDQIKNFLNSSDGKNWSLINELRIWPHIQGFDGFYAATLKKIK